MKKTFMLEDLDCAHCAAKMEDAINKLEGVNKATVNFLAQKMTVDAVDDRFDEIMQEIVKVCKKVEPDCEIKLSGCIPFSRTAPSDQSAFAPDGVLSAKFPQWIDSY